MWVLLVVVVLMLLIILIVVITTSPWEAVVLLPFIDEVLLLQAERQHCRDDMLTSAEKSRNSFATVISHYFDPKNTETYLSCNPEIGLPDILNCQSTVVMSEPSLGPGAFFRPEAIPGTVSPIAGFPTLAAIPLKDMETDFVKVA